MAKFEDSIETVIRARDESTVELRKAEQARREILERERGRSKEQEKSAAESARVQAEIVQLRLRREGKYLQANIAAIRSDFAERIAAAKQANDTELADRLRTLRRMREAEARNADVAQQNARNANDEAMGLSRTLNSGVVNAGLRAVATFGAIELGLGTINVASEVFSGNMQDAAEAAKQMPAGIGPVARQLETLLGAATGITAEVEQLARRNKLIEQSSQLQFEIARLRIGAEREINSLLEKQQRQRIAQSGLTQGDKDRRTAALDDSQSIEALQRQRDAVQDKIRADQKTSADEQARLRDIESQIENAGTRNAASGALSAGPLAGLSRFVGLDEDTLAALEDERKKLIANKQLLAERNQVRQDEKNSLDEIIKAQKEINAQDRVQEGRGRTIDALRAIQEEAVKRAVAQQRQAATEETLAREVANRRLELDGDVDEAARNRINQRYDDQIAKAKTAAERELLEQSRTLDLEDAKRDEMARREAARGERLASGRERRERFIDAITKARTDTLDKEITERQEALARARRGVDADAAPGQADQNRFLTGVREESQSETRQMLTEQQKAVQAMEKNLTELQQVRQAIGTIAEKIKNSPVAVLGRL